MEDITPTVFVVDDDPSFCRVVERLLQVAGHRVETYASPAEFVSRRRPDQPGCLVLDMRMPDIPGLEV
jgi:FixJ family two-component response regulator